MGDLRFRRWDPSDERFLWEMLHESLHVRDGDEPFPHAVLEEPAISRYLTGFGSRDGDDAQVCAGPDAQRIGAAWCRRFPADDPGFGFVSDDIPELAMAVARHQRGRGIGRRLLEDLLDRHPVMSLSVDSDNAIAVRLYRSVGFTSLHTVDWSITMLRRPPGSVRL